MTNRMPMSAPWGHGHAEVSASPAGGAGYRPAWPLIAATNQVLRAARWRRSAAGGDGTRSGHMPPVHPPATTSPTSGWFFGAPDAQEQAPTLRPVSGG